MKKILKALTVMLIIQLIFTYMAVDSIKRKFPVKEDQCVVKNTQLIDVSLYASKTPGVQLIIYDSSQSYILNDSFIDRYTRQEISDLISSGDIVTLKYYTSYAFFIFRRNIIVELRDSNGNYFVTLDDFNENATKGRVSKIIGVVITQIILLISFVLYFLYCKYVLRIKLKKKKKRKKVDKE